MSPGRSGSHSTGLGSPVTEFSNSACWCVSWRRQLAAGRLGDRRTAWPSRTWSLPVAIGHHLEVRVVGLVVLPEAAQDVAVGGRESPGSSVRPWSNSGSAPTSEGPKSLTMTSIWSYFAMAAVSTFWLRAGSQLVTSKGCSPIIVYFAGSSVCVQSLGLAEALAVALGAAQEEHVAAVGQDLHDPVGPVDAVVDGVERRRYFVKSTPSSPPGSTR